MKSLTNIRGVALALAIFAVHPAAALGATGASNGENTPLHLSGTTPTGHVSTGGGSSLVRTIVGLFIVIAVIYGISWILKTAKRSGGRSRGKALSPIASLPLGSGRSVQLVRAGNEILLIGVAEHSVTPIRSYTEAEALDAGLDVSDADDLDGPTEEERPFGRVIETLRRMTVRS
jgi:flagellar protein FliO/FliZ